MKTALFILLSFIIYSCQNNSTEKETNQDDTPLPFLGDEGANHVIADFQALNQDSIWKTNKSYSKSIWVAEFFFSTCPTICPIMNSQMNRLVKEFEGQDTLIQFLSFSINPDYDSPSVLQKYINTRGYDFKNWDFLTGMREESVHLLGVKSFLVHAGKGAVEEGGYAHSGAFTMVDEQGHVRGVYQITDGEGGKDENEYQRLKKELKTLLKHEYGINH